MNLQINNETIELVYSFRSNVYFEQIQGYSLDFTKLNSNDLITLFYSVTIASLQKAKKPIITMLDFMDVIDDNGGEKCIMEFSHWYIEVLKTQYEVLNDTENDEQPKDTESKKKIN